MNLSEAVPEHPEHPEHPDVSTVSECESDDASGFVAAVKEAPAELRRWEPLGCLRDRLVGRM